LRSPFVAPAILALWLAILGLFIPGSLQADAAELRRNAEQRALERGSLTANKHGTLSVKPVNSDGFDHEQLLWLVPDLKELKNLTRLDLSNTKVVDIAPLKDLTSFTDLDLSHIQVVDFAPLKDLKSLSLGHAGREPGAPEGPDESQGSLLESCGVRRFAPLNNVKEPHEPPSDGLRGHGSRATEGPSESQNPLSGNTGVEDLTPLHNLKSLTDLGLSGTNVSDLTSLRNPKTLAPLCGLPIKITANGELLATCN